MRLAGRANFGFLLPMNSYEDCLSAALEAENLDINSLWVYDDLHGFPHEEVLEPLTTWSFIAQATSKVTIGSCVIAIQRHHPVTLSKALVTIDWISKGRIICGIGAGGSEENYSFPPPSKPVKRMSEAIEIMKALWTRDSVDYAGEYYRLSGARLVPKPLQKPHPPIWLGANSPETKKLASKIADGWLPMVTAPQLFKEDLVQIREWAEKAGRSPNAIRNGLLLYTLVGKGEEVREIFAPLAKPTLLWVSGRSLRRLGYHLPKSESDVPIETLRKVTAYGAPEDVAQMLGAFLDAGVEHFVLGVLPPERAREQMRIFVNEVLPLI
ncbi:MAG: LLM class flavin-dependent oxidoreductase [Thermoproteota archaeon]